MVEFHRRSIDEPEIFRLSLKARKEIGLTTRPVYLLGNKVPHYLGISDALVWLMLNGNLDMGFCIEPRINYRLKGKDRRYDPDAFFIWNGQPYFLEYQSSRTDLSARKWAEKWKTRNEFFGNREWEKTMKEEPVVVVVSRQQTEKVKTGAKFKIRVMKDISEMQRWIKWAAFT